MKTKEELLGCVIPVLGDRSLAIRVEKVLYVAGLRWCDGVRIEEDIARSWQFLFVEERGVITMCSDPHEVTISGDAKTGAPAAYGGTKYKVILPQDLLTFHPKSPEAVAKLARLLS